MLISEIKQCTLCESNLPLGCNPIVSFTPNSKVVLIGQAPGNKVHESGIPWNDASGHNLRNWLGVDHNLFYNPELFALIPMGFCYPGRGKSGDLPPRQECAPQWQAKIFNELKNVKLIILIGKYAQNYYLGAKQKDSLTNTVQHYFEYLPQYFVLPHPSPRNNIWQAKNSWFKSDVIPALQSKIKSIL